MLYNIYEHADVPDTKFPSMGKFVHTSSSGYKLNHAYHVSFIYIIRYYSLTYEYIFSA